MIDLCQIDLKHLVLPGKYNYLDGKDYAESKQNGVKG
jgi:hypothetical protein